MKITASDRSALVRLAASLPKGDESRRAILAGLQAAVVLSKPDPKKKYELIVYLDGGQPHTVWKKDVTPSQASALAKKQFDLRDKMEAAQEDGDNEKAEKLQDQLSKMHPKLGPETYVELHDPETGDGWSWSDAGWDDK